MSSDVQNDTGMLQGLRRKIIGAPRDLKEPSIFHKMSLDSGSFKGIAEVEALKSSVADNLRKYVDLARKLGLSSDYRMDIGTDVVETATQLCTSVAAEYPSSMIFAGKLVFQKETIFNRFLHNETAFAIQRRLQWEGVPMVILPVRVMQ